MLKKSLLSLAIAAGLGLAGCSGTDSTGSTGPNGGNPNQRGADQSALDLINNPGTYPLYNPANSVVPVPSDLQYSGTTDGTLVFGGEDTNSFQFIDPDTGAKGADYNPVFNAIADLDGASVNGQIDLPFSAAIDPATVVANQTVFLVPLVPCQDANGNDLDPVTGCLANGNLTYIDPTALDGSNPSAIANSFGAAVSFRAEVIDQQNRDAGSVLRISPLEPLAGATRYMVFLTNGIQNLTGDRVNPSLQYHTIGSEAAIPVQLAPVRSLVQGYEQLASGYIATQIGADLADDAALSANSIEILTDLGVDPTGFTDPSLIPGAASAATTNAVVMSYSFTTGGTNQVLAAMAAPGVANSALQQNHALDGMDDAALEAAITAANPDDSAEQIAIKVAGAKALRNLSAPKARTVAMKTGVQDFGVPTFSAFAGTVSVPYYLQTPSFYKDLEAAADPVEQLTGSNVIAKKWLADDTLAAELGNPLLTPPTTKVTRHFPWAKETGTLDAPITVYLPAGATSSADINGTVIYQHGITTNRSAALPFASQAAAAGYAVVAMDLTIHGLEPDSFVDANGLVDFNSTGAKLSPLNSVVVDQTALAVVAAGAGLDVATVDAAVTAVEGGNTDEANLALYTSYSTAVLGQYMLNENHFGLTLGDDGVLPRAITADDIGDVGGNESGSMFVYLGHHQITRDNLRQSVMNLLNLGASLGNISIDIDGDGDTNTGNQVTLPTAAGQVHFVGHSLGSIVGTSYVAINNSVGYYNVNNNAIALGAIALLDTGDAGLNNTFQTALTNALGADNLACGNASTFVTDTLQPIEDGSDGAIPAGTVAAIAASDDIQLLNSLGCGNNALPHLQTATLGNGGGQLTKLLENSDSFAPTLLPGLLASDLIQTSSSFEAFMNIFQATIDSVDPSALSSSYSSSLITGTTGVLHMQVNGDDVVPNGADDDASLPYLNKIAPRDSSAITGYQGFAAPLAGTEPLMHHMGLTNTDASVAPAGTPVQLAVRFTAGDHSSFGMASLLTGTPAATDAEMAAQITSFLNFSGTGLTVTNAAVIQDVTP